MVNGETVTELGTQVRPGDVVWFDGEPVEPEPLEYHLLNKPVDVISAVSDPRGRRPSSSWFRARRGSFPSAGSTATPPASSSSPTTAPWRTSLMHPRFEVDKVYKAEVEGEVTEDELDRLRNGVELEDGLTSPAVVLLMGKRSGGSYVEVVIHEGRKRQVRRMFEAIGHPVWKLHRKRYAMLTDAGLAPGESRPLKQKEIEALRKSGTKEKNHEGGRMAPGGRTRRDHRGRRRGRADQGTDRRAA